MTCNVKPSAWLPVTLTRRKLAKLVVAAATSRLKLERMRWTVSEPTTSANAHRIVNVSSAETPARRVRIGRRSNVTDTRSTKRASDARTALECFDGCSGAKDVARSADRVQQSRLALGLQLATQIGDEHLDRVGRREGVVAPHLVQQALA